MFMMCLIECKETWPYLNEKVIIRFRVQIFWSSGFWRSTIKVGNIIDCERHSLTLSRQEIIHLPQNSSCFCVGKQHAIWDSRDSLYREWVTYDVCSVSMSTIQLFLPRCDLRHCKRYFCLWLQKGCAGVDPDCGMVRALFLSVTRFSEICIRILPVAHGLCLLGLSLYKLVKNWGESHLVRVLIRDQFIYHG